MEENNKKRKSKLPIVIIICVLLLVLSVGVAYAYFSAVANNSGDEITGQTLDINGSTLTISASRVIMNPIETPVSDNLVPASYGALPTEITTIEVNRALTKQCSLDGYTGCHVWKITARSSNDIVSANIRLNLNVATVTDKGEWSYVVYTGTDSSSTNILYKGIISTDFGNTVNTIDIHNGAALTANTSVIYYVMVYLNNTNSVQNDGETVGTTDETGTYNGSVTLEALGGHVRASFRDKASDYITNLYTNATKSTATVNNITYNLAPSVGLMNDRHASMSTDINGGDIRYYGANPNNYVWLGDSYTSDYTIPGTITSWGYADKQECLNAGHIVANCTEDIVRHIGDRKLWRVIGVFNGRVKLVQNDLIGDYSWDTSASAVNVGTGINQWGESGNYEGADLMRLLNPGYEDTAVNNSLYWTKGTGTVYTANNNATTADVSFANTGLSSAERNMIDTVTWYTGAYDNVSYVDAHYSAERGSMGKICSGGNWCNDEVTRTSTWSGKVGLIYPSDYGYAANLLQCNQTLSNYNQTGCIDTDWLKANNIYWTVSLRAHSAGSNGVFIVIGDGYLNNDYACISYVAMRPAVYLKPNVVINYGAGTEANPYVLSY